MSEWTKVQHREECEIRSPEEGEVVSTLAGPQWPAPGDFVLRRRLVPHEVRETEEDELRTRYHQRYGQAAPQDADRDGLYTALGYGWDERVIDSDYAEHHFRMEDLEIAQEDEEPQEEEEAASYWDQTNDYLRDEIERRQAEGREIEVAPPGNKAELVEALEADDNARSSDEE